MKTFERECRYCHEIFTYSFDFTKPGATKIVGWAEHDCACRKAWKRRGFRCLKWLSIPPRLAWWLLRKWFYPEKVRGI